MSDIFSQDTKRKDRVHLLKSWPGSFDAILAGEKPFDVRFGDRDYRVGDWVKLHWYDPELKTYNGDACYRRIGHLEQVKQQPYVILGYVAGHPDGEIELVEPKARG